MKKTVKKKERTKKLTTKILKKSTHVYTANTDKDCDLLQVRPVLWSRRTLHEKNKNRKCLDCSQYLVMSPTGTQRQDGLTDGPTDRQF
jgi:hypothetical protein